MLTNPHSHAGITTSAYCFIGYQLPKECISKTCLTCHSTDFYMRLHSHARPLSVSVSLFHCEFQFEVKATFFSREVPISLVPVAHAHTSPFHFCFPLFSPIERLKLECSRAPGFLPCIVFALHFSVILAPTASFLVLISLPLFVADFDHCTCISFFQGLICQWMVKITRITKI